MNQRTSGRMNESTVQHPILDAALGQREEKKNSSREYLFKRILVLRNASLFEDRVNLEGYFSQMDIAWGQ